MEDGDDVYGQTDIFKLWYLQFRVKFRIVRLPHTSWIKSSEEIINNKGKEY